MMSIIKSFFARKFPSDRQTEQPRADVSNIQASILSALTQCGEDPTASRVADVHDKLLQAQFDLERASGPDLISAIQSMQAEGAAPVVSRMNGAEVLASKAVQCGRDFELTWSRRQGTHLLTVNVKRSHTTLDISATYDPDTPRSKSRQSYRLQIMTGHPSRH